MGGFASLQFGQSIALIVPPFRLNAVKLPRWATVGEISGLHSESPGQCSERNGLLAETEHSPWPLWKAAIPIQHPTSDPTMPNSAVFELASNRRVLHAQKGEIVVGRRGEEDTTSQRVGGASPQTAARRTGITKPVGSPYVTAHTRNDVRLVQELLRHSDPVGTNLGQVSGPALAIGNAFELFPSVSFWAAKTRAEIPAHKRQIPYIHATGAIDDIGEPERSPTIHSGEFGTAGCGKAACRIDDASPVGRGNASTADDKPGRKAHKCTVKDPDTGVRVSVKRYVGSATLRTHKVGDAVLVARP